MFHEYSYFVYRSLFNEPVKGAVNSLYRDTPDYTKSTLGESFLKAQNKNFEMWKMLGYVWKHKVVRCAVESR
jgi:hypothetical protein